jgi:RNA polymerase sigma-70 factor (ECF subfamily)
MDVRRLYALHGDWLRKWLRRHTGCSHRAADLAQDTFCRLLERPENAPLRTPRSYLATIARRLVIDDARRARVEAAFLETYALVAADGAYPGPDRIAEAIDELLAITRALGMLPERTRRAYLLSRLEGWNHSAIAEEMGVSKSMVKQYVAKAYAHCYAVTYGTTHHFE